MSNQRLNVATSNELEEVSALAVIDGKPYKNIPEGLYIPPDALEVFLDKFEGPLDLLLYLIKHQDIDILNIPILNITEQYIEYINRMEGLRMELAGEYLVMASMLAEIKSKMLLPRQPHDDEASELDPRAELVRRLLDYERYKKAAEEIDQLSRLYRDNYPATAQMSLTEIEKPLPSVELDSLLAAFKQVLKRVERSKHHQIEPEALSVKDKMAEILRALTSSGKEFQVFTALFKVKEGRQGLVVTFLAILELCKEELVEIVQTELFSDIWLRLAKIE